MLTSSEDQAFRCRFEAGEVAPDAFDHRAHLRLAYVYNAEMSTEGAVAAMRAALLGFLQAHGVDPGKYHTTMTEAWVRGLRHVMGQVGQVASFEAFLTRDGRLLDQSVMFSHYSRERLFSEPARTRYLPPDLDPIPN